MSWPTLTDYQESIQDPKLCFEAPELRDSQSVLDPMGLPKAISGNFACVYEMHGPSGRCAVRCFIRQVPGQQGRYNNLSKYLSQVKAGCLVDFEFVARGIMVKGDWYPIVKMAWVEGSPLNQWIEKNVRNPQALAGFLGKFRAMMKTLRENNVAHGDLQHGNIMVTTQDEIRLVDYDGIYCPVFGRGHAPELGHINFQHPRRTSDFYEEGLDNFAALLIHASIQALIVEPELLDQYYNVDNLLLSSSDFKTPMQSALFERLKTGKDPQVRQLATLLQQCCVAPIEQVPWYEDTLVKLEKGEPLILGQPAATPSMGRSATRGEGLPKRQLGAQTMADATASGTRPAMGTRPVPTPALSQESDAGGQILHANSPGRCGGPHCWGFGVRVFSALRKKGHRCRQWAAGRLNSSVAIRSASRAEHAHSIKASRFHCVGARPGKDQPSRRFARSHAADCFAGRIRE